MLSDDGVVLVRAGCPVDGLRQAARTAVATDSVPLSRCRKKAWRPPGAAWSR